ncbi:MAG: DEAD/DEAH box helicase family protein [Candidatus Thiodiazotropha taylori]|uniref:DEAD/DEAH box helicase family protein n=1 Tax=Candidatus Thiodiazotropha taylori TaxID=2792791 RepID=A0A9E4N2T1_9GAMM|nr:DEAD/DEAH box helicase family protein [Candidatus Thiodiazotropha taylori]MCW4255113.1 DEAD/DEAH box helicase family protein [Candidatus Thiodiazotropha taylori]
MKLRWYQEQIVNAQRNFMSSSNQRGQIIAPTGSGKTVCFTNLIVDVLSIKEKASILIVHPRIALSEDQQSRLKKDLRGINIQMPKFTSFHSGAVEETAEFSKNKSTTNRKELETIIDKSKISHVTFTSYHSFEKIADMDFDVIICDESHNLTQKKFSSSLPKIKSKVLFYTATQVIRDTKDSETLDLTASMDNPELFGDVEAQVMAKDLIKDGYVLAPRLRLEEIQTETSVDGDTLVVNPVQTIAYVFKDQIEQINNKLTHKMLVAMPNTKQFEMISAGLKEIRDISGVDLDIYTITAEDSILNGGKHFNTRKEALDDFSKNINPAIIVHCDTLAEGIDVDGLSGVFIFRTLQKHKFIQTIGRSARPYIKDLNKEGEVKNMENRIKPNALVTIPVINGMLATNTNVQEIVEAFAGFGDLTSHIDEEFKSVLTKETLWEEDKKTFIADVYSVKTREVALNIFNFINEEDE